MALSVVLAACGPETGDGGGGGSGGTGGSGGEMDSGMVDSGMTDAGSTMDAGSFDAGFDAGVPPVLNISDLPNLTEGNMGTGTATFTVTLSAPSTQTVTVEFATANGTATSGSDYTAATGTLTFAPGDTSEPVTISLSGDTLDEVDETFTVTLTNPANATLGTAVATGTIIDDDATPSLSIDDVSRAEGSAGSTTAQFTVTLSQVSGRTVTVNYATANLTPTASAVAGTDYTAASGTLTFAPGDSTKTITVTLAGDAADEFDETYHVILSGAANASITKATGIGTITNDDSPPTVSIDDVSTTEGNSGTKNLTFTVSLSTASGKTINVNYASANRSPVSATAGVDYTAVSGSVSFAPGETTKSIAVSLNGDGTLEADETFQVDLTLPMGEPATFLKAQGLGTLVNDDAAGSLTLSVNNISVSEGNSGTANANFTVTLSAAPGIGNSVSFDFATANGPGGAVAAANQNGVVSTGGFDYVRTVGRLTISGTNATATISVPVNGDAVSEPDEEFLVNLSNAFGATISTSQGRATITNDDPAQPTLSFVSTSVTSAEGLAGQQNAVFLVQLSNPSSQTVTVVYATSQASATQGSDYGNSNGTLVFPAGDTVRWINVPIYGDNYFESNETYTVLLANATNAALPGANAQATGTITNDDAAPSFSVNNVLVNEGNSGIVTMRFAVTMTGRSQSAATVAYATAGVSATSGSDFFPNSGTLTFNSSGNLTQSQNVDINVLGDAVDEAHETLNLVLSNPSGGALGSATGTGTIRNDDSPLPMISIGNAVFDEGPGVRNLTFTVTISRAPAADVVVTYATADGTAIAGADYTAVPTGSITFPAASAASRTITVPLLDDALDEDPESLTVTLTAPASVFVIQGVGTGSINDNDATPNVVIAPTASTAEGDSSTAPLTFVVTLQDPVTLLPTTSGRAVSVHWSSYDGTAVAATYPGVPGGNDFIPLNGMLTIPAGNQTGNIVIQVNGDATYENNETMSVQIAQAVNANLVGGQTSSTGTITNDDVAPTVTITNVTQAEGTSNTGNSQVRFIVSLSAPSPLAASVQYTVVAGTATVSTDFTGVAVPQTLNLPAWSTSAVIAVNVAADSTVESDETFFVEIASAGAVNAVVPANTRGTGTIQNDD